MGVCGCAGGGGRGRGHSSSPLLCLKLYHTYNKILAVAGVCVVWAVCMVCVCVCHIHRQLFGIHCLKQHGHKGVWIFGL